MKTIPLIPSRQVQLIPLGFERLPLSEIHRAHCGASVLIVPPDSDACFVLFTEKFEATPFNGRIGRVCNALVAVYGDQFDQAVVEYSKSRSCYFITLANKAGTVWLLAS